jgi:hypothetical protein
MKPLTIGLHGPPIPHGAWRAIDCRRRADLPGFPSIVALSKTIEQSQLPRERWQTNELRLCERGFSGGILRSRILILILILIRE